MTNNYQEIHNLNKEIKRLQLLISQIKDNHNTEVKALKNEIIKPRTDLTTTNNWKEVLRAVCTVVELTPEEVLCVSRKRLPIYARHMFHYICRKRLGMGLTQIGGISNRDHSTIINSVREYGNILWVDKNVQKQYGKVCVLLNEAFEG